MNADAFQLPPDIHYLNCAYMSPTPRAVEEAGMKAIVASRNPTLLDGRDFFEPADRVRALFAALVGSAHPERVSIAPAVSYATSTAARNVPVGRGDQIVVLEEQFPSNMYAWRRLAADRQAQLVVVTRGDAGLGAAGGSGGARSWTDAVLGAITPGTRVVAVPQVHWTDGSLLDLEAIGRRAREVGAWLIVDGTQSVGALPIDVEAVQPDLIVAAGYKWLLGPYSTALALWSERMLGGVPLEENWINRRGSENFAALVDYEDAYAEGAIRYDVGERSNFLLLPMLEAALELVTAWTPEAIQAHCAGLVAAPLEALVARGFRVSAPTGRASHLFGIRLPAGLEPEAAREALASASVYVSVRGSAIRVAPHVYNTERDLDALVDVLVGLVRS